MQSVQKSKDKGFYILKLLTNLEVVVYFEDDWLRLTTSEIVYKITLKPEYIAVIYVHQNKDTENGPISVIVL